MYLIFRLTLTFVLAAKTKMNFSLGDVFDSFNAICKKQLNMKNSIALPYG